MYILCIYYVFIVYKLLNKYIYIYDAEWRCCQLIS